MRILGVMTTHVQNQRPEITLPSLHCPNAILACEEQSCFRPIDAVFKTKITRLIQANNLTMCFWRDQFAT